MIVLWVILLAVWSGVLGRCGGVGKPFSTWYRDIGCSYIVVVMVMLIWGWKAQFWWIYALIFSLHWAAFSTYWDWLFGYDNFWFSGAAVGLSLFPILFLDMAVWPLVLGRSIILALIWWSLNRYLPQRVWIWRRDVAEEFSRYFVSF